MIDILPYHPEHLQRIKLKDVYKSEGIREVTGHAITVFIDQIPVAILGWSVLSDGVIGVAALLSDEIRRKPIGFHKKVLSLIDNFLAQPSVRRMQFTVKTGYTEGWKWALSLGFKCEGIMRKYGPDGSDYWLFARCA